MNFFFYHSCVEWPHDAFEDGGLSDMNSNAKTITRETFLRHVNRQDEAELEAGLGYAPHCKDSDLRMSKDWHISYHKGMLYGQTVYFFRHSLIEYVFAPQSFTRRIAA
jgi:hypothetical protein